MARFPPRNEFFIKEADSVNEIIPVFIEDSSSGLGNGLTGVVAADLVMSFARIDQGNAGATTFALTAGTRGTYVNSGGAYGWVEKDATNQPGEYELSVPNTALGFTAGVDVVLIYGRASGAKPIVAFRIPILLVGYDPSDGASLGLTNIANMFTDTRVEDYAAFGSNANLIQLLYAIRQGVLQFSITNNILTVQKLDRTTPAMTFLMDSPSAPTLRTQQS